WDRDQLLFPDAAPKVDDLLFPNPPGPKDEMPLPDLPTPADPGQAVGQGAATQTPAPSAPEVTDLAALPPRHAPPSPPPPPHRPPGARGDAAAPPRGGGPGGGAGTFGGPGGCGRRGRPGAPARRQCLGLAVASPGCGRAPPALAGGERALPPVAAEQGAEAP